MLGIHWAGLDLSPVGRAGRPTYRGDNCWSPSSPLPELEDGAVTPEQVNLWVRRGFQEAGQAGGAGGGGTLRVICGANGLNSLLWVWVRK